MFAQLSRVASRVSCLFCVLLLSELALHHVSLRFCVASYHMLSTSEFAWRHVRLSEICRRRRRLAAEDSPASDASGAQLDGADTLLDTVDASAQSGGASGAGGAGAGNDAGNGPVDEEEEEEDDGDVSDPPPIEYNADRDREIDEDPDHSDGGEGAGDGEEVRAFGGLCLIHTN